MIRFADEKKDEMFLPRKVSNFGTGNWCKNKLGHKKCKAIINLLVDGKERRNCFSIVDPFSLILKSKISCKTLKLNFVSILSFDLVIRFSSGSCRKKKDAE